MCHEQLGKEKVAHAALQMGCPTCHGAVDAKDVPHKITGKAPKGLSGDQPDLCYNCHDRAKFTEKNVHAAIGMGCTGCHNPHSSKNAKLLKSDQPDLCYSCHDKAKFSGKNVHAAISMGCTGCHNPHSSKSAKLLKSDMPDICFNCHDKTVFTRKNVHMPVAGGMCMSCHKPHASDHTALLIKEPYPLCLDCHANVRKAPHAVAGFSAAGHPLGGSRKWKKPADDPMRPGKRFYCGSCHDPHSSDSMKLFRYKAASSFELCAQCHKM
jgi:DmsE family decaheme c-type cytochrome